MGRYSKYNDIAIRGEHPYRFIRNCEDNIKGFYKPDRWDIQVDRISDNLAVLHYTEYFDLDDRQFRFIGTIIQATIENLQPVIDFYGRRQMHYKLSANIEEKTVTISMLNTDQFIYGSVINEFMGMAKSETVLRLMQGFEVVKNREIFNNMVSLARDLGKSNMPRFVQLKNPRSRKWVKIDTEKGGIVDTSEEQFEGVTVYKW